MTKMHRSMGRRGRAFELVGLICLLVSFSAAQNRRATITWQPQKLVQGSPVLFEISGARAAQSIQGSWLGHEVTFIREEKTNSWYGLAGVSLETPPGSYELSLTITISGGKTLQVRRRVNISPGLYPKITIKVAKQFTEPDPKQLTEIAADKEVKQKAFAIESPQRLWAGQFQPPVSAAVSDVFGTARVINQEVKSRHQGLDFAAPVGSEVHAVNRGTVILARPLFFEGNCVVIDHGQGLLSLYLHLSEFKVKEGDEVDAGQAIALSGGTGRATGPHLHLAIRWQGIYLNPAILLKLSAP